MPLLNNPSNSAEAWAQFASRLSYNDLPNNVRRTIRLLALDTLATTLAASALGVGVPQLLAWARSAGGAPQASLIGLPHKLPAVAAAALNGAMAHALNFDDTTAVGSGHLGPVTIPPALASAELRHGASGKELIAAVAAGAELMSRIGAALAAPQTPFTESKPQPTQMPGAFAAAISASRMLQLPPNQTHSALGLALMQASGGRQPVLEGRPAKAIYAAFPSQAGMLSAILARDGLLADCDAFDGDAGFFPVYYNRTYDPDTLLNRLGDEWLLLNVGLKPWPTTGVAHVFIEAAAQLRANHNLNPRQINRILLRGEPHIRTFCEPLHTRRNPQTPIEAEDSIPFATAQALLSGNVTLANLQPNPHGLFNNNVLQIANRVDYEIDESLGKAGVVELSLHSGQTLSARVDHPKGHRDNPLTDEQRRQKFRDCAVHAASNLSPAAIDQTIAMIESLDDLPDIRPILSALSGA